MSSSVDQQQQALAKLRIELNKLDPSDPKHKWALDASDAQCLKFLVGHKLRVDEAYKLMVRCSTWRYEYKTDDLIAKIESPTAPQEIRFARAYIPMGVIGKDADNRPVYLNRMSAVDFPRVIADFGLDKAIEFAIYVQEKLLENNPRGECIVIIDLGIEDQPNPPMTTLMEARAWISALLRFLQPFAAIVDPFYPEMFHKIFFTRAPSMFAATWSIAKNFVAEATREKIEILGSKNATKRLLEVLPRDVVPIFLGGDNQLKGLGKGGKLPKGASKDLSYLEKLESDILKKVSENIKIASSVENNNVEEEEETIDNPLQKRAALDVLRAAIRAEMEAKAKESSSERGSWHFVPGKDFLENLEDDELEQTLKQYNYDHVQSFQALYQIALQKERIQVPPVVAVESKKSSPQVVNPDQNASDVVDKSNIKNIKTGKKGWFSSVLGGSSSKLV